MWDLFRRSKQAVIWLLEQAVIVAVAILVLDVLWGVFTRFVLDSPSRWTEEVATFTLIWVSLLGAAVAFDRQEHLGVDYFVKKLDPTAQLILAVVVQLVVLVFAASAMVYGGFELVTKTLNSEQLTPALEMKMGYVYLAVPLSGLFIMLSCLERILELLFGQELAAEESTNSGEAT